MGLREDYEARKAAAKAWRDSAKKDLEESAREQAASQRDKDLARLWFFRHPDKLVQYTGWLQLYTAVLSFATAALVAATIYSAFVLRATDEKIGEQARIAADQLTIDRRAWIAPKGIIFDDGQIFGVGMPLNIRVLYGNTGKEPAIDLDQRHEQILVVGKCADGSCMFEVPSEHDCDGLVSKLHRMVVYPGTIVNENGNGVYDEIVPPRALSAPANPVVITKSVNDRTSIIVAKGCFAYLTAETTHVSAYCYKFDGSRTDLDMSKWEWRPCEVGYYAN